MPLAIGMSFPGGHFHATPWGHHVNEGVPEWPPSPWRLLRALVAVWKRKLDAEPSVTHVLPAALAKLAAPPVFHLPPATLGHTRHYMPWFKGWKAEEPDKAKTKVFDAFVALAPGEEVVFDWPHADLDESEARAVAIVLANLNYFGRAESWCEARLMRNEEVRAAQEAAERSQPGGLHLCQPLDDHGVPRDHEIVRVLCADPTAMFRNDRFTREQVRSRRGRKITEKVKTVTYDPDWHLCAETGWLHDERWSDPPGSKWVRYIRRSDCFQAGSISSARISPALRPKAQVVRFVLDSTVLPLLQDTLPIAEQARRTLMGIFGHLFPQADGSKGRSVIFSGKDDAGEPLLGHRHAYYLPTDEDGDGRLDHLTVVAEEGFGQKELQALDRLRHLQHRQGGAPLNLLLLGLGRLNEFISLPSGPARLWVSATPFIATRHPKRRGRKRDAVELLRSPALFLEAVLREELVRLAERRGDLPAVEEIAPLTDASDAFRIRPRTWQAAAGERSLRPLQFKRFRRKTGGGASQRHAGAFRIGFSRDVAGPICLGQYCHFGLGLFLPEHLP